MKFEVQKAFELYQTEKTITDAAKKHCIELGIPYEEKYRHQLSRLVNKEKVDQDLDNFTETETNQYESISTLSALKPDGTIMSISEYCSHYGIPFEQVKTFKLITHTGRPFYNVASNTILQDDSLEDFRTKLLEDIAGIPNKPKTIKRSRPVESESYLLVVDAADVHIGKLADSFETGDDYDSQIAVQRVREGVEGIIEKTKGFPIDKVLFVGGNDILHIDTPKATTTSGTFQNTSGMWYTNFLMAKDIYIEVLNRLLEVADVHFVFNPSNHDYMTGFFLADVIKTYYKDSKSITFDCDISHRKYFVYGENLIGTSHGDGGKMSDLPLTMAHESKDWSSCKHKYFYIHHFHHKISKDYMGVNVEALRSPSGTDAWHSKNLYHFAPKAIEGFLHSKVHGQIARITHLF